MRRQHANPEIKDDLHALRATIISNDLYGSEVMSAFEAAECFSRPPLPGLKPISVSEKLIASQQELAARRKLIQILRSKALKPSDVKVGDLVQKYVRHSNQRRRKWLSPRQVLAIDENAGIVTVPGLAGKKVSAAVEDTRAVLPISDLSEFVMSTIDELNDNLDAEINEIKSFKHVSNID